MKIRLFQELLALNEEFGHVIHEDPVARLESGKGMVAGRACRAGRSSSRDDHRP